MFEIFLFTDLDPNNGLPTLSFGLIGKELEY